MIVSTSYNKCIFEHKGSLLPRYTPLFWYARLNTFKEGTYTACTLLFEHYLKEQNKGVRQCFVAFCGESFAGYVTLKWHSVYRSFAQNNIPEISDLNVLPAFGRHSIGTRLIEKCEAKAATQSSTVGIGVGLCADYGAAQRLYVKRGYVPDGQGAIYQYKAVTAGESYPLNDDLIGWFTKTLS